MFEGVHRLPAGIGIPCTVRSNEAAIGNVIFAATGRPWGAPGGHHPQLRCRPCAAAAALFSLLKTKENALLLQRIPKHAYLRHCEILTKYKQSAPSCWRRLVLCRHREGLGSARRGPVGNASSLLLRGKDAVLLAKNKGKRTSLAAHSKTCISSTL